MLILVTLFAAAAAAGCGQDDPRAERQKAKDPASEGPGGPTMATAPDPVGLGETAEVGPFAVTLNDAARRSAGGGRYAVVDLALENRSREPADASEADFMLRDGQGYSFETGSAPDQRPRPQGRVEPGAKSSGQVAFELGDQQADGRLELVVSLPDRPGARAAYFGFEAEKQEGSDAKPEAAQNEGDESGPSVRPGYRLRGGPERQPFGRGPLLMELRDRQDSEKEADTGSWSYHAGEYLTASITTASSLDAWYGNPGNPGNGEGSGAYMVASEALARQYTDDELIYSLLYQNKEARCAAGPSQDLDRPPYSGKIQTWFECDGVGTTYHVFAAAPEGRACVVVGGARIVSGASEADREAVQHIVDSFEVDCDSLPPSALLETQTTASPSASASASAHAVGIYRAVGEDLRRNASHTQRRGPWFRDPDFGGLGAASARRL